MVFADLHCDFLSKAACGASFETPQAGQAVFRAGAEKSGLALLGLAAFCWDSARFSREEMRAAVAKQMRIYRELTKPERDARLLPGTHTRALLTLEGLDAWERASELEPLLQQNVSAVGLMWNHANAFGGGAQEEGPLTAAGADAVRLLEEHGVRVDLAHACPQTFFEAAEYCARPFVSHGNVRAVTDHARNLRDDQIRLLIERGGLLGLTFYTAFAGGDSPEALWRHAAHVLDMGGEDILAVGSDFDGCKSTVRGLETVGDYGRFADLLRAHGVSEGTVKKICYTNAAAFFGLSEHAKKEESGENKY